MLKSAIKNIMKNYDHLTKSEKKLADYIFQNQQDVEYMSIVALAEVCDVAEATVSRFCRKLKYSGYNEFKLALAKDDTLTFQSKGINHLGSDEVEDPFIERANHLFNYNVTSMQETISLLDKKTVETAIEYIQDSNHVYCIGQGSSMVMAMEAWARFSVVTTKFIWIPDSHMQSMTASLATGTDVILLFSYSGATRDSISLLKLAREQRVKIILVTHYKDSPAAAYADLILLCGSKEGPLEMGSVAAKMGQLLLIDILYHEYCAKNPQMTSSNRDISTHAIAKKLL